MSKIELVAPCHFGLEAVLKKEILDLGYEIVRVEDGREMCIRDRPYRKVRLDHLLSKEAGLTLSLIHIWHPISCEGI